MNLYAYMQIDELSELAKFNNIEIPRLRGYEWMKNAKPDRYMNKNELKEFEVDLLEELIEQNWDLRSPWYSLDDHTNYLKRKYIKKEYFHIGSQVECIKSVKWELIHGWKRKLLKTFIHNELVRHNKQIDIYNKYVGREDVLMIHSRIGGCNWKYYKGDEISQKPWFLEKVDDSYDSTYCDIYAKIEIPDSFK